MADKIVSTLKGRVKFEADKSSLSSVRKEIKKLKEEMKGLGGLFGGGGRGGGGGSSGTPRPQKNFEEFQKRTIKNFLLSSKLIRSQSEMEKDRLKQELMKAKTREELKDIMIKERSILQENLEKDRIITKQKQKQVLLQRRLTSSTEQMVGALGSAFVAVEAFRGIVNTGMKFESFEKTFLAVSDDTKIAKQNMEFARKMAMEMGVDVIEAGKAYARMIGSSGKTPLDTIRETFTAVSKATVAMGLSADDQMGIFRAMSQILSKQKFTAEEVRSQIGDRGLPAMQLLTAAAQEAGLAVDEIGIDKLMERGDLTVEKILPFFNKELIKIAENNNAYAKAVRENFAPAFGRATNALKDFSNEIFQGGLKDSLVLVLNNFADLTDSSKTLAKTLGVVLGGAITGLVFPFKLLHAVLIDIGSFFDIGEAGIAKMIPVLLGAAAGTMLLLKGLKMIVGMVAGVKALATAMKGLGNAATRTGKSAINTAKSSGKGAAKGTSKMMSFFPAMARTALSLAPTAALALTPSSVASGTPDLVQESGLSPEEAYKEFLREFNQSNKTLIEVRMTGDAEKFIKAEVSQGIQNEISEAYNTVGSSKD